MKRSSRIGKFLPLTLVLAGLTCFYPTTLAKADPEVAAAEAEEARMQAELKAAEEEMRAIEEQLKAM